MRSHHPTGVCKMNTTGVLDPFVLQLKIALYVGLAVSAPFWLHQLEAFIASGRHRQESRFTYIFGLATTPLLAAGCWLGFELVSRSMSIFSHQPGPYGHGEPGRVLRLRHRR
jgi:sec-independent protein translocase protein TatC